MYSTAKISDTGRKDGVNFQSLDNQRICSGSLYRSLVVWAALQPDAPLIIEAETGQEYSYAQTLASVNTIRQLLGERPRTIVLALPGGIISAVIWLSTLSGGHTLIPLSPDAADEEKARIAHKYKPDLLVVEEGQEAQGFHADYAQIITRQECAMLLEQATPSEAMEPVEGYVCLMTSGTTGEPKGVLLNEYQIAWTADHVRANHRLSSQDRGLTVLPFFHVNAPVVSLCSSLLAGSTVIIARHFSRRHFWSWVRHYQVTWVSLVPTIVSMLLATEKPAFLPGPLRFVRTGSAALPATDALAFEARFDIPVIETYGLSEAASQVVANPLPPGKHKPGSAGLPVGVALRICHPKSGAGEEALRDTAAGETGEICIAGPSVIRAYLDNVGQEAFQHGWFRTGDLGYLDKDGYLFIKGRLREVINRGGENIAPREVEEVLQQHEEVLETAVVGRPDAIYGELVVAYIVVRQGWRAEISQELRAYAAQRLSPAKIPVDFIVLDTLPKNATGKVERRLLHAQELARAATHEVEQAVRAF